MILYAYVLLKEKIDIFFIYCLVSFIYVYVYITPLGRPRHGWEDNIRMNLKEIGINARNWVGSTQDRELESVCECGIEPPGSISHGVG